MARAAGKVTAATRGRAPVKAKRATAVPLAVRWTEPRREAFLAALAQGGVVTEAARAADVPPLSPYDLRRTDTAFRAGWEDALDAAYARLELLELHRATYGDGAISETEPNVSASRALGLLRLYKSRPRRSAEPIRPMRGAALRNELQARLTEMNRRMGDAG